jgi:uncharacterized membrane protein (UPF0127 family)
MVFAIRQFSGWIVGALAVLYVSASAACPFELPVWTTQVNGQTLTLEVAVSSAARACGLSGRTSLAPDRGMLFVMPQSKPVAFWMHDTELALSIAFLDEQGRIVDIQTMQAEQSNVLHRSPGPVRYALEVNKGWFARHQVKVGDIVQLPRTSQ